MRTLSMPNGKYASIFVLAFVFTLILASTMLNSFFNVKLTDVVIYGFASSKDDFTDLAAQLPKDAKFMTWVNIAHLIRAEYSSSAWAACPTAIKKRKIIINYASNCCQQSQPKNCHSALSVGGFDVCISFGNQSLDEDFSSRNANTLKIRTGAGLWLWKPYIIWRTLMAMRDDDVLFYADSGSQFMTDMVLTHICFFEKLNHDVVLYVGNQLESQGTKMDSFILMDADQGDGRFVNSSQLISSFLLLRRTPRSLQFISEWLTYAQDYRILGNELSVFGREKPGFQAHRNDQSILSLLAKRWLLVGGAKGFGIWADPSQNGEANVRRQEERFKQISKTVIYHSRDKT